MLLIGAGGLGSPASLYLAAAGVGKLGIVDADVVDETNLQRQIVHSTARLGEPKVRSAARDDPGAEPRRRRRAVRGAPHLRERGSDHRRRLGRDRRRRRQLPDALSRQRRVRLARRAGRPRLDLPLRGPGDRVQAERGAVLPLPLPAAAAAGARAVVRGGRRARRAAGRDRLAAGDRDAEARARHRQPADRPAAALRRADGDVRRGRAAARSSCPVCGDSPTITEYIDYVEFCAGVGDTRERRPHSADAARRSRRRTRGARRGRHGSRGARRPGGEVSRARLAHPRQRRHRPVRERLRRRRRRAHARGARHSRSAMRRR